MTQRQNPQSGAPPPPRTLFGIAPAEALPLATSFLTFACLLACYYILRPVRDALAAGLGADAIKYLSSAVFLVMLGLVPAFGWLVAHVPRARLVPALFGFFIANLCVFAVAFGDGAGTAAAMWWARAFYVWITVFNLFAVSVFWSRMADVWSESQGRRLFGIVSAGGSCGGIAGPLLARALAAHVAVSGLVWISAALLAGALAGLVTLAAARPAAGARTAAAATAGAADSMLGGVWLIGRTPFLAGIAALVCFSSLLGMVVYVEMARLVAATYPSVEQRTAFFAGRDLWVNGGALLIQLFLVGEVTRRFGVGAALVTAAALACVAFVALGLEPALMTLAAVSILLRCAEFGLAKPARDMCYTVVPPAARYQSKNFIDTALYRGSDMASGWLQAAVSRLGVGLGGWGWISAGLAAGAIVVAALVGRGYRHRGGL
jgi:AAA family ATP:ADP antiporter